MSIKTATFRNSLVMFYRLEKNKFDFLKIQQLEVEIEEERRVSAPVENRQRGQREGTRTQMCLALQKRGRQYLKSEAGSVSDGLDRVPRIHLLLMPLPHRAAIYMGRLFSYTSATNNIFELHYIYKFKIKLCSKFIVKLLGLFF